MTYWKRILDSNPERVVAVFSILWPEGGGRAAATHNRKTRFGDGIEVSHVPSMSFFNDLF